METKFRSDSALAKLSEPQLDQLYDWLLEHSLEEVRELAVKPAPEGFGLQFHKTTLTRFLREEKKRRHAQHLAELAAADQTNSVLSPQSSKLVADLITQSRSEFAHAIYELSLAAHDPKNFDRLERALHNMDMVAVKNNHIRILEKNHALAQDRLAFEKLKFEFDATREALNHAVQYVDTLTNPTMDDQDKVWKAREICFGPMPQNVLTPAFHAKLNSRPGQAAAPDTVVHAGTQSPNGPTPLTQLAPVQNPEVATAAAPELSPESSDLSPTPSTPPSVLEPEAKAPDTLKHNSSNGGTISGGTSSTSPAVLNSFAALHATALSPQSTVLEIEAQAPDTLGHVKTQSQEGDSPLTQLPPVQIPEVATAAASKLSTQSSALSTGSSDAPVPRSMTAPQWMSATKDRAVMQQYLLHKVAKGSVILLQKIFQGGYGVTIDDPQILSLVPNP